MLEGSVRRAGDRIRVTAQLIRAADGFHIWSEYFDRGVEDVISIQEDLAINIAKALKTTMDPVALEKMLQAGTRSVKAYEHYLNGLALNTRIWETSDYSLKIDALDYFERALGSGSRLRRGTRSMRQNMAKLSPQLSIKVKRDH